METIGDRIRKRRKELGISVEELAKAAELRPTTLYDLERSHSKSTTKLHLIAARLTVDVRWLEVGGPMVATEHASRHGVRDAPPTIHGYAISSEGAALGAEWDKLDEPMRTQVYTMIHSLVAEQVRMKRSEKRKRGKDDPRPVAN